MSLFEIFVIVGMGGLFWEVRKMEKVLTQAVMKLVIHDHDIQALKKQAHTN